MIPEEFTETEVVSGETTYTIYGLLTHEAFDALEKLRPGIECLSSSIREASAGYAKGMPKQAVFISIAFDVIAKLPGTTIQAAIACFFPHVEYSRPGQDAPRRVNKDLADAFKDQDPLFIYELLIRSFCVNFKGSSAVLKSLWERLQVDDGKEEAADSETSIPSLPIQ